MWETRLHESTAGVDQGRCCLLNDGSRFCDEREVNRWNCWGSSCGVATCSEASRNEHPQLAPA